jgi:hypothetical protein
MNKNKHYDTDSILIKEKITKKTVTVEKEYLPAVNVLEYYKRKKTQIQEEEKRQKILKENTITNPEVKKNEEEKHENLKD